VTIRERRSPLHLSRVALALALFAPLAHAASPTDDAPRKTDPALRSRVHSLLKIATDQMQQRQYDAARKNLLKVREMARERGGTIANELLALTHVYLGAAEILEGAHPARPLYYFKAARCRDPGVRLTGWLATQPAVAEAFHTVKPPPGGLPHRCPRPRGPDLPVRIQALDCPNPDEVPEGHDYFLRCAVAPTLPIATVSLFYRPTFSVQFEELPMRQSPRGWWTATIPAPDITGKSLQYYFEARNASGKPIVRNGEGDSPNIVLILDAEGCPCD